MTRTILLEYQIKDGPILRIVHGDLTRERVDAIVNAANNQLWHGGGVAGAILHVGGYTIQQESTAWVEKHGPVPTGSAAITGAGRLPCKFVIHAVGPVWNNQGTEDSLLNAAIRSAITMAERHGLSSLSIPGISTGIFGFPRERGARVIIQAVIDASQRTRIEEVNLTNIDQETARIFHSAARGLLKGNDLL